MFLYCHISKVLIDCTGFVWIKFSHMKKFVWRWIHVNQSATIWRYVNDLSLYSNDRNPSRLWVLHKRIQVWENWIYNGIVKQLWKRDESKYGSQWFKECDHEIVFYSYVRVWYTTGVCVPFTNVNCISSSDAENWCPFHKDAHSILFISWRGHIFCTALLLG